MKFDIRETARERIILCAHRGIFGGNIPCNTIASFDFAIAEGADMVELDVTKSADGELFVFHPGMERRQFCKDVSIRKMNAADVRELTEQYGVRQAPTLVIRRDGGFDKFRGVSDIKGWLMENQA